MREPGTWESDSLDTNGRATSYIQLYEGLSYFELVNGWRVYDE